MVLTNIDIIKRIDKELDDYLKQQTADYYPILFNLGNCFKLYKDKDNFNLLMAASFDFKINLTMASYSLFSVGAISNENRIHHNKNIISCIEARNFKLDFHKHYTDFIFRYRALLDKYMGLIVMELKPDEYNNFISSTSRKKAYKKFCKKNSFSENYITIFDEILSEFDNKLRTPEAHAAGRIRKFTLTDDYNTDELYGVSLTAWNMLVSLLSFNNPDIKNKERFSIYQCNYNV